MAEGRGVVSFKGAAGALRAGGRRRGRGFVGGALEREVRRRAVRGPRPGRDGELRRRRRRRGGGLGLVDDRAGLSSTARAGPARHDPEAALRARRRVPRLHL